MITPLLITAGIAFYFIGAGFASGIFTAIYFKTDYILDQDTVLVMSVFWPFGILYIMGRALVEYVLKDNR